MGLRVVERPVVWHANKKSLPMTGFEPRSSGVGSDRSTNWAVWLDWSIFESSRLPIFKQKKLKCIVTLGLFKTSFSTKAYRCYLMGIFWEKLGYFLFQHLVTLTLSQNRCPYVLFCSKYDFRWNDHNSDCVQCDQMARLLFKYLTIYNSENLPNSVRNFKSMFKILPVDF